MFKKRLVAITLVFSFIVATFGVSGCGNVKKTIYTIDCEFDGKSVCGTEKVEYYNDTDNAFKELKFNLFANAFRKDAKISPISAQYHYQAYKWGESFGGTEIFSVMADGEEAEFTISGEDMNVLIIPLKKEVFPNEMITVEIEFKTDLAKVIARTGINSDTVNLANFYPVLCACEDGAFYECVYYPNGDPFFSDVADYTVNFTCGKGLVVAASGERVSMTESDGKTTYCFKICSARSFTIVLSDKFRILSKKCGDTEILYYYYDDEDAENSLSVAINAFEYFCNMWGKYPYKTYSVVQTPFIQGGMEFTALTFISAGLEPAAYKEVIVHETAHEWWQTVVGNNEIKHPFIDEGLAEYSVVLFYEANPDYGYTRQDLIKSAENTYKLFCSVYARIVGNVDTTMTRSLAEYTSEYEYVNIAYVKACIMFDYLRQTVGDEIFFAGLKRFYNENAYKIATPESLVGAFERAGANSNGFFDSFFNGKAII